MHGVPYVQFEPNIHLKKKTSSTDQKNWCKTLNILPEPLSDDMNRILMVTARRKQQTIGPAVRRVLLGIKDAFALPPIPSPLRISQLSGLKAAGWSHVRASASQSSSYAPLHFTLQLLDRRVRHQRHGQHGDAEGDVVVVQPLRRGPGGTAHGVELQRPMRALPPRDARRAAPQRGQRPRAPVPTADGALRHQARAAGRLPRGPRQEACRPRRRQLHGHRLRAQGHRQRRGLHEELPLRPVRLPQRLHPRPHRYNFVPREQSLGKK